MNLFELFVKIGVDDQASGKLKDLGSKLGSGLATAAKIGTAAVGAAAAGITALTKQSVQSYAEFEQLVGGAELMFGGAFETVMQNAQNAYKTVQMSQNEYLQQVNGFATGLKTALGGNEQQAADLAHRIIQAEADIVAATGNTAENVQNAFNGIMKSNFTMLDNLQIGITPTKEGFQEVIDKVNEWNKANGEATSYQMGNLADMQSALVDYIEMVGMSGYAQREASETITGSLSSMKAAWTNLVIGFADDSADLDELIGNLTDSVVGYTDESGNKVKGVLDNLLPAIEKSLDGIAKLIEGAAPKIIKILPGLVTQIVPSLISAATDMVNAVIAVLPDLLNTVVDAIIDNAPLLIDSALALVGELVTGVLEQLPQIVALGLDLIVSLANGIAESLPELIPTIIDVVLQIVDTITDPSTLSNLVDASIAVIIALANGLIDALPALLAKAPVIVSNLVFAIIENAPKLLESAAQIVTNLVSGIIENLPSLGKTAGEIIETIISGITSLWSSITSVGSNIVSGVWQGIQNGYSTFYNNVRNFFKNIVSSVKSVLGIKSPSRVFRDQIGKQMAAGIGVGFKDEFANVKKDIDNAINFDDASIGINASVRKIDNGFKDTRYGTTFGSVSVVQNIYSEAKTAADLMQEAIYQQERAVLLGV